MSEENPAGDDEASRVIGEITFAVLLAVEW